MDYFDIVKSKSPKERKFLLDNFAGYDIERGWIETAKWKEGEPEAEFDELHYLLEKLFPQITFIQYKILWSNTFLNTRDGGYGDQDTLYTTRRVGLGWLFRFLDERVDLPS